MLSLEKGKMLVELARTSVENYFRNKKLVIEKTKDRILNEKRGVFVTIENSPDKSLRGCIGYPSAVLPLYEAVQRAACSSAFEDTRFSPLKTEELDKITFEISVLTMPKLIQVKDPKEYEKKIEIGKDGLIMQSGPFSGLLLPQVATEFNWDAKEFLENLCYKAGLTLEWIRDKNTRIWKFQAQIFCEKKPRGEVIELH